MFLHENTFEHLSDLKYLDLSNNFIFHLGPSMFNYNSDIIWLDMSSNYLQSFTGDIIDEVDLKILNISNNFLVNIDANLFESLTTMIEEGETKPELLDISNNQQLDVASRLRIVNFMEQNSSNIIQTEDSKLIDRKVDCDCDILSNEDISSTLIEYCSEKPKCENYNLTNVEIFQTDKENNLTIFECKISLETVPTTEKPRVWWQFNNHSISVPSQMPGIDTGLFV